MIVFVPKSTSINLRITPEFREQLEALAAYRGLTMSGMAHSLLTRALRKEQESEPEAFTSVKAKTVSGRKQTIPVLKGKAK